MMDTLKDMHERDMADPRRAHTLSPDEWAEYQALKEVVPALTGVVARLLKFQRDITAPSPLAAAVELALVEWAAKSLERPELAGLSAGAFVRQYGHLLIPDHTQPGMFDNLMALARLDYDHPYCRGERDGNQSRPEWHRDDYESQAEQLFYSAGHAKGREMFATDMKIK